MLDFLPVGHRSVGLVCTLRQQNQVADAIPVVVELMLLFELIPVLVKLVSCSGYRTEGFGGG